MDSFGTIELIKEDADAIKEELDRQSSVLFTVSGDNIGALIVLITSHFSILGGPMPFGGNPKNRIFISILGRGSSHFSTDKIHSSYFEEKLNITKCEAEWIEKLWDLMWGHE